MVFLSQLCNGPRLKNCCAVSLMFLAAIVPIQLQHTPIANAVSITYQQSVLTNKPVLYYRLDETSGTALTDSSGNSRTGTYLNGTPVFGQTGATEDGDTAVYFPGTPVNASVGTAGPYGNYSGTGLPTGNSPRTIELFLRPTAGHESGYFLSYGTQSGTSTGWNMELYDASTIALYLGGHQTNWSTPNAINFMDGNYHQVDLTWDGTQLQLYVDGLLASLSSGAASYGALATSTGSLRIGSFGTGGGKVYQGALDDISIYNSALSATQVAADYHTAMPVPPPMPVLTPTPHTFLWAANIYAAQLTGSLQSYYLGQLASWHLTGSIYDNRIGGSPDNFIAGVNRYSTTDYNSFVSSTEGMLAQAKPLGLTDFFLRMNADIYCPTACPDGKYKWDVFNANENNLMAATFSSEAAFIKTTGLTGMQIDAEPYDYLQEWDQEDDTTMAASKYTVAAVAQQYYNVGKRFMAAALAADPTLQVLTSNVPNGSEATRYKHYQDFVAGMIEAAVEAGDPNGFVFDRESFAVTNYSTLELLAGLDLGANTSQTTNIRTALQSWDATNGTHTWNWHLAHDTSSLASEPYLGDSQKSLQQLRYSADTYQNVLISDHMAAGKYAFVYDESGVFANPVGTQYTCAYQGQTVTTTNTPCAALVTSKTLPAVTVSSP